jgi:glycosyltransferase involved in cell wall biosynthesis
VVARVTGPDDARGLPWAAPLAEQLDWADVVWVEWCQRTAALVTMLDPGDARVVVRLHSHEAFTVFPHLLDLSRVDDVVFVAGHLRELVRQVLPGLEDTTRTHVVPNLLSLDRFSAPGGKEADARFTLGVVGVDAVAKDPLWAVELLARLRGRDARYRLLLVGTPIGAADATGGAGAQRYRAELDARLAQADVAGAVDEVGRVEDVPGVLRRIGVLVSSSTRESFHLAVVEGAASGAVPVVRDWPLLARYGGPRALFPADWVASDLDAAAARVLQATATPEAFAAAGTGAREAALAAFDAPQVAPTYERLLLAPTETP